VDLLDLKSGLEDKTDQELMELLQDIRHNRRTPPQTVRKSETKKSTTKKESTLSLDALLASDPNMKDRLLAALLGGKK
jgi:hypothetical protein